MSEVQNSGGTSALGFVSGMFANKPDNKSNFSFFNELSLALDTLPLSSDATDKSKSTDDLGFPIFDDEIELPEIPGFININVIGLSPEVSELSQQDIDNLLSKLNNNSELPVQSTTIFNSFTFKTVDNIEQFVDYSTINSNKISLDIDTKNISENISESQIPDLSNIKNTESKDETPTPTFSSNKFTVETLEINGFQLSDNLKEKVQKLVNARKGREIDLVPNEILNNNIDSKMEQDLSNNLQNPKGKVNNDNNLKNNSHNQVFIDLGDDINIENESGNIDIKINSKQNDSIKTDVINYGTVNSESNIIKDLKEFNQIINKINTDLKSSNSNDDLLPKKIKSGFNEFRNNIITTNNDILNFNNKLLNKIITDDDVIPKDVVLNKSEGISKEFNPNNVVITKSESSNNVTIPNEVIATKSESSNNVINPIDVVSTKAESSNHVTIPKEVIATKSESSINEINPKDIVVNKVESGNNISNNIIINEIDRKIIQNLNNENKVLNKNIDAIQQTDITNQFKTNSEQVNSKPVTTNITDNKLIISSEVSSFQNFNDSDFSKNDKNSFSNENQTSENGDNNQILTKKSDIQIQNDGEFSTTVQNEPIKSEVKEVKTENNVQLHTVVTKISNKGTTISKTAEVSDFTLVKRIVPEDFPSTGLQLIKNLPENGSGTAKLILQPQALGTVIVEINMTQNKMRMEVKADTQEAVKMIENQLGSLKEKLASNGIITEKIDVSLNQENLQNFGNAGHFQKQGKREDKTARNAFIQSLTGNGTESQEAETSSIKRNFSNQGSLIEKYI